MANDFIKYIFYAEKISWQFTAVHEWVRNFFTLPIFRDCIFFLIQHLHRQIVPLDCLTTFNISSFFYRKNTKFPIWSLIGFLFLTLQIKVICHLFVQRDCPKQKSRHRFLRFKNEKISKLLLFASKKQFSWTTQSSAINKIMTYL